MTNKPEFHGSDLEKISAYYNIPMDKIISFSANVNPLGISPVLRKKLSEQIDSIMKYPDRDYTALRSAIGTYCGTDPAHIILSGGVTELLSLSFATLEPKKAMLISPTYSEYAREVGLTGGETVPFFLLPEEEFRLDPARLTAALDDSFDLLIFCNPNNPTATTADQGILAEILSHCLEKGIFVLIDETYIEFSPEMDSLTAVPLTEQFDNVMVLRGVSKFFAAPGLRLGYGITGNTALLDRIHSAQNPWTINSLAAFAGGSMFSDTEYIRMTKEFTQKEMRRLYALLLQEKALHVYPPSANFFLLRLEKEGLTADQVFDFCIRQGLMLRDCSTFPGLGSNHIRFCLQMPEENDRLLDAIRRCL